MSTPDTSEAPPAPPPAEEIPKESAPPKAEAEVPKAEEAPKVEESPSEGVKEEEAKAGAENAGAPVEAGKEEEESAATGPVEGSLPSFKEESYFEKDLKASEKEALHEFSEKVEAGIKGKEFVLPPKVEVVKETTEVAKVEEAVVVASTVVSETKDVDSVVKVEEAAVAVIVPEEVKDEASPAPPGDSSQVKEEAKISEETPAVKTEETPVEKSEAPPPPPEKSEEPPTEKSSEEMSEKKSEETPAAEAPAPPPNEEVSAEPVAVVAETTTEVVEEEDLEPPEELELWGVPLLPSKGDPRTQVIFLKFLRARDFKVKEAFVMLKNCILWRKKNGIGKILEEDLGTEFDSSAFNHGVDKDGHPVQYNVFGAFQDKVFSDSSLTEKALRWRIQLLEKQIQSLSFHPGGVTSILQVVDLRNAQLMKKRVRQFMSQAVNLLADNYPELVVKIVILNVPWYFNALYAFLSPFLTQRMKSKYTIASSLFKFITPDNIPVQYGGLSRVNDADFGDGGAPVTELVLKAGEKKTAEIEVAGAGDTVVWELALVGSDVTYGAEFVPSKEGGYTTIVEKAKKIAVLEEPVRTSFKSPEPGKLVLSVDNSLSRKKKTVLYRHIIKSPTPPPPAEVEQPGQ